MVTFNRDNPVSEQELYKEIQARQATYKKAKRSVSVDDARRASAISKAYPNFSPDVITALTTLQVKPESVMV